MKKSLHLSPSMVSLFAHLTQALSYNTIKSQLAILCMVLALSSCNLSANLEEARPVSAKQADASAMAAGPGFSYPISLHRVDIFTTTSSTLTGTVTMQIRSADGSVILGTSVVNGSNIVKGHMVKNTFLFSPNLSLNSGQKYRIYLTRSNPHNYMNDHITWRTSSGGNDAYPKGVPSVYPAWVLDFAFVTYSDGYTDQQQLSANYGFAIGNNGYRWQEFVPSKIWVIGQ